MTAMTARNVAPGKWPSILSVIVNFCWHVLFDDLSLEDV